MGPFVEKAMSRMKRPDRPQALMKFNAISSDLALNWEKAYILIKCKSKKFNLKFSHYVESVCCLLTCNQSV